MSDVIGIAVPDNKKNDHESREYRYGTLISGELRTNTEQALGDLLTTLEASMQEGNQLTALKKIVKNRMYFLMDYNQHAVYQTLNVE